MINQDKKTFNPNHPSPIIVSVCDGGCGVGSGEAAGTVTIPPPNHIFVFAALIFLHPTK
jgi:hypothetical protein